MGRPPKPEGSTYQAGDYIVEKHKGRWVKQHRLRMEQKLGRKLKRGEIVHHKDNNTLNNKFSNLKLLPSQSKHMQYHARIASADPEERKRRSERAKKQHAQGKLGRATWSEKTRREAEAKITKATRSRSPDALIAYWKDPANRKKQSRVIREKRNAEPWRWQ